MVSRELPIVWRSFVAILSVGWIPYFLIYSNEVSRLLIQLPILQNNEN